MEEGEKMGEGLKPFSVPIVKARLGFASSSVEPDRQVEPVFDWRCL
jgi:hypothetical protein